MYELFSFFFWNLFIHIYIALCLRYSITFYHFIFGYHTYYTFLELLIVFPRASCLQTWWAKALSLADASQLCIICGEETHGSSLSRNTLPIPSMHSTFRYVFFNGKCRLMTSYMDSLGFESKSTTANKDCHKGSLPLSKANIALRKGFPKGR